MGEKPPFTVPLMAVNFYDPDFVDIQVFSYDQKEDIYGPGTRSVSYVRKDLFDQAMGILEMVNENLIDLNERVNRLGRNNE